MIEKPNDKTNIHISILKYIFYICKYKSMWIQIAIINNNIVSCLNRY